ncbi:conserved hypothetical protein [Vibrio phage 249E41-1]|nr:conserved hypothetical protein [Vibrio phage 249E41-1]
MCWGTPSLRTPCCGKMGCNPENNEQVPPSVGSVGWQEQLSSEGGHGQMNSLLENSQLSLWQNYCNKKMECEELRDLLKDAAILLVNGTEGHCTQLSDKIIETLKEK